MCMQRKCVCLISLVFLLGLLGMVDNASALAVRKGPYLIYLGSNTTMEVLWQLDATASSNIAWGLDTSYSTGSANTSEFGSDHQHKYTISGLTPGTKYYYKVTPSGLSPLTGSFLTAPAADATSVKILAYGDTRTNPGNQSAVCSRMNSAIASDPGYQTLLLLSGDWVESNGETNWTNEFFNRSYAPLLQTQATVPINGCMGNHEGSGTVYVKYWPYPYVSAHYWSFDYGPAHIAVVDQYVSYSTGSAQLTWLANDLANSNKLWKFIVLHAPGWSCAGGHSNTTAVQSYIQPLCVEYDVQIVFCGHNHYYSRAVVNGVHHVTTGGGGAPLATPASGQPYIVTYSKCLNFCKVNITGDSMAFQAIKSDGTVIDTFDIEYAPDTAAPTPDPMTWASVPAATGSTTIAMTATTGSDVTGPVQYFFQNTTTGMGSHNSGWQTSTSWTDTGLTAETTYSYHVQARDSVSPTPNVGGWSTTLNATTQATPPPDTNAPTPDPMTWASVPTATGSTTIAMAATTGSDATGPVQYFFQNTTSGMSSHNSGWQTSTSWTDTGLTASTQYSYQVQARDSAATPNVGGWSTTQSATTLASGGAVTLFSDYFDSGVDTLADGTWTRYSSSADYISAGAYYSSPKGVRIKGGSALPGSWIQRMQSTVGYTNIHVKYARICDTTDPFDSGEYIYAEWSTNGTTWYTLESTQSASWALQDYACASGADNNANFRIRFRVNANAATESAYVDNVEITATAGGGADTAAPTPNPMTWASVPAATGSTTIAMTATTGSDATGPVEYFFQNTTTGMESHNSGWQTGTSWTDPGLSEGATYSYQVQARDSVSPTPNVGSWSTTLSATTLDVTAPTPNPMTWSSVPAATGSTTIAMTATTGSDITEPVQYFFQNTTTGMSSHNSGWQTSTSWTDTGLTASTQYSYQVQARDSVVNPFPNVGGWSATAYATTQEPPADTTAPTPDPMTWASVPAATGSTTIAMTATTGSDATGPVQYFFQNTTSGMSSHNSGWQTSTSWTDTGLTPSTQYSYQVQARDSVSPTPNVGGWSTTQSATTQAPPDTTAPTPDPMTWASVPTATGSTTIAMAATTGSDATGPVQYFFQNTTTGMSSHNSGWQTSTSWTDTGLTASTQYSYQVQARDSVSPTPNVGGWSTTQSATTQAGGGTVTLFSDNFDGNDTLADGTWTRYSTSADYISAGAYYSSPKGVKIKGGSALPGSWIQRMQSTAGYTNIHVKYARKCDTTDAFDAGEYIYAEWSTDGTNWNNLETTQDSSWALKDYTCASGADNNANFRVRFRVNASGATEYAFVDDVNITGATGGGDTTAPTPNPMTWSSVPAATGSTTIAMTATTGSDSTTPVQYFFQNTTAGMSSHNSGWQTSTSWTDTGLTPSTQYSYQVQARDSVSPTPNVGGWSTTQNATTQAPSDTIAPTPNPMTWASVPTATGSTTIAMTATTGSDATGPVQYFFQNTTSGMESHNSGWQTSTSWTDTGLTASTTYSYQVQARDSVSPTPNVGGWSTTQSATTQAGGTPPVVLFSDYFDSGVDTLANGPWTRYSSTADYISAGAYYSSPKGVKIKGGSALPGSWIQIMVDTTGYTSIHVKYARIVDAGNPFDAGQYFYAEWSTNGTTWNTLESTQSNSWALQDYTCASGADNNTNFRVRFRVNADEATESAYVDNVEITGDGS